MHKMVTNSRGQNFPAKKEAGGDTDNGKINKLASASSRSSWSGLKDPRVVRVSRTFGGKDRHSKVCTVRGLRDRRVRLSVPTAIQLYDLQDRLGLNQPSKVVDWLLSAAKDEIDELPPLQIPPGTSFGQLYPQSMIVSQEVNLQIQSSLASLVDSYVKDDATTHLLRPSNGGGFTINDNNIDKQQQQQQDDDHQTSTGPKSKYWNLNSPLRSKCKEVAHETTTQDDQRSTWCPMSSKRNIIEQESQEDHNNPQVISSHHHHHHSFPTRATQLSCLPVLQNNVIPQSSFYHWDPSNLSLSGHLGSHGAGGGGYSSSHQTDQDPHNFNILSMTAGTSSPSLSSLPSAGSHHHQLLVCPSGATPPFFQPYVTSSTTPVENSNIPSRSQINHGQHFQMLSSAGLQNLPLNSLTPSLYSISPSATMRPLQLDVNINPKFLHSSSQNNNGGLLGQQNKGNTTTQGPSTSFTSSYSFHQNDHQN